MIDVEFKLIGERIRHLRNRQNITIEELSHRTEIDYSYLAKMEKGKVNFTMKKLLRLSKEFNIDLKDFFNFGDMKDKEHFISEIKSILDNVAYDDLFEIHSNLVGKYPSDK